MKYEQESENFTISCPFSRILPVSQSDLAAHQAKWAPTSKAEAWVFWMICQFPLLTIAIANVGTLLKQNQSVTHIWSQLLFSAIKKKCAPNMGRLGYPCHQWDHSENISQNSATYFSWWECPCFIGCSNHFPPIFDTPIFAQIQCVPPWFLGVGIFAGMETNSW